MNILYLTNKVGSSVLPNFLKNDENHVIEIEGEIDINLLSVLKIDFIISYGYRHILSHSIIEFMQDKIINLHISYLPWNRGADPNFWSWVEDTLKGVTIHQIDKGIDTGDILVQKEVKFSISDRWQETFQSSYIRLKEEIEDLFMKNWKDIKLKKILPIKQMGKGSYHQVKDKIKYEKYMSDGWLTRINEVQFSIGNYYQGGIKNENNDNRCSSC